MGVAAYVCSRDASWRRECTGMNGRQSCRLLKFPPPSFPRKRESNISAWIPGLRSTPPGMTGEPGDWYPFPISAFSRTANRSTAIPAKAGIQCLGMDSGSPFHSARNDRWAGWLLAATNQHISAPTAPPPSFPRTRESSTSAWIPGLRFTPPGMTGRNRPASEKIEECQPGAGPCGQTKKDRGSYATRDDPRSVACGRLPVSACD